MSRVLARPTVQHAAAPVAPSAITAERYVSPQWLAREADRLWPQVWLFACLARDVAEPGRYVVVDLADESIVVTCDDDGEVRAFYNVCQHRGMRLLGGSGCAARIVCGYHGWTYRPDGRLAVVPDHERFAGGVDRAERSLKPVRVDTWAGMVWVCMDPDAVSLADYLGEAGRRVLPYRLEDMTLVGDQTVQLDCNWKAVFDNFGELYHVEHIHPQHKELFDCPTALVELFDRGHTGVIIDGHTVNTRLPIPDEPNFYLQSQLRLLGADPAEYVGRVLDIRPDAQKLLRQAGPRLGFDYDRLSDEQLTDVEQYNFFPNTMITVLPDSAMIMRARPHPSDPDRCWWDKLSLRMAPSEQVARAAGVAYEPHPSKLFDQPDRPVHDEFTQEDIIAGRKTMTATIDQDIHLIRDIQRGMHSRGFGTAQLCDDEARVQHYHDWMNALLGLPEAAAAPVD